MRNSRTDIEPTLISGEPETLAFKSLFGLPGRLIEISEIGDGLLLTSGRDVGVSSFY